MQPVYLGLILAIEQRLLCGRAMHLFVAAACGFQGHPAAGGIGPELGFGLAPATEPGDGFGVVERTRQNCFFAGVGHDFGLIVTICENRTVTALHPFSL